MVIQHRREIFHERLTEDIGYAVYFRPPTGFRIDRYPCIVYDISDTDIAYADNSMYVPFIKYEVTLLTRDPEDEAFEKLLRIPHSRLLNSRKVAGLNEYTFYIYY